MKKTLVASIVWLGLARLNCPDQALARAALDAPQPEASRSDAGRVEVACTGAADSDTARLQAAIRAAIRAERPVAIAGHCRLSSPIEIDGAVRISGNGHGLSTVVPDVGIDAFRVDTPQAVYIGHLDIIYAAKAADGTAAIDLAAPAEAENTLSRFEDLYISLAYDAFRARKASLWTVSGVYINAALHAGLLIDNQRNGDSGDSVIEGSTIADSQTYAVLWKASGGLRFTNNKVNTAPTCFKASISRGVRTTGLFISNNSMEGCVSASIDIENKADRGTSLNVVNISGNELTGRRAVVVSGTDVPWLASLAVTNNIYLPTVANRNALVDIRGVSGYLVGQNIIHNNGGSTSVALIGPNCRTGAVTSNVSMARPPAPGEP